MKPTGQVKVQVVAASGFGVVGDATYFADEVLLESDETDPRDHVSATEMPFEVTVHGGNAKS